MPLGLQARLFSVFLAPTLCLGNLHADTGQIPAAKKPSVKVRHPSIYDGCLITNNNNEHSIIPIYSVLYLPKRVKSRVTDKPIGKLIVWPTFIKRNQDWIWTFEVTRAQAKGIKPIPKAKMEEFTKLNRLVVATNNGNPVAILPQKKNKTPSKDKATPPKQP